MTVHAVELTNCTVVRAPITPGTITVMVRDQPTIELTYAEAVEMAAAVLYLTSRSGAGGPVPISPK